MKKAAGKSPKSEVRGPKHQGATSSPASSFSLHPSAFTRIPWWLLAVLLVLVTMALYWPVARCDFIVIDDAFNVTANVPVQKGLTWEGVKLFFFNPWAPPAYTPVTMLTHMAVCQVCGLNSWGHHLGNVLVHALNAGLVFAWLRQMTGATWRSVLVAALFAVHPLRVEPVAWVTERREVLCACFGLLTLMAYVRYVQGRRKSETRNPKPEGNPKPEIRNPKSEARGRWSVVRGPWSVSSLPSSIFYLLSVVFYACGLLSKPTLVTWPFVLLLLDYWPLGRIKNAECRMQNAEASDTDHAPRNTLHVSRFTFHGLRTTLLPLLVEKIPFFVLSAFLSATYAVGHELSRSFTWGGNHPLGARLGNAVYSYGWYLGKLFWPADLAVIYPHPGYWPLGKVLLAGGLILGLTVLAGLGWRRRPYLLVGWLWYCGTLVPNSQMVQSAMLPRADRWTYLPLLGFLIAIVWGACELTRRWRYQVLGWSVAGGMAIVLCMALTRRQIGYWKDSETLLRHSMATAGSSEAPLTFLGTALRQKGQIDEAIRQYQAAIRLNPDFAPAYNELGTTLGQKGQIDEAIIQFQEAIRIEPGYTLVHFNLGNALLEKGQTDEAIREYREALRRQLWLTLGDPNLHNNLGLALARKGQTDEAITQYQEALRLEPDDPDIHFNLGVALAQRGQMDEAIRHYQEALRRQPDRAEAHNNLGAAFHQQGRTGEAIREFQEALRLKPDYAGARRNLNAALAAQQKAEGGK